MLGQASKEGGLVVCGPVYAVLLAHPKATERFVYEFLSAPGIEVDCLPGEEIWRESGRRFAAYAGQN